MLRPIARATISASLALSFVLSASPVFAAPNHGAPITVLAPAHGDADASDDRIGDALGVASADPGAAAAAGPIVHIINEKPDSERGLLKLARYRGSSAAAAPNVIVVTTHFEEICTEPCGVSIDVSERPMFFLVRDERAVSYPFRLNMQGEVTLSLRPQRNGLLMGGILLTSILILPAAIPMWIFGKAKVSYAPGAPSENQVFKKLKPAKS